MIIDAHVHYTPPQSPAELEAFAAAEPYWGLMLAPRPGAPSVQGWATPERMIDDMDAAGIDKVVLVGEYRRRHEGCVARNDAALAITLRWPDRVIAFAMIQPLAGQAALDELARCLDGGMAGVGELGPYGQGYRLDEPAFLRLVEACIDAGIPINLHTNEEVGHYYPGKAATPVRDYYRLACRYPELRLILAHWGAGLLFYELMPEVRRSLANVWYDTAASPLLYPTARIFNAALACVDHRKLLYASDYPLLVYPRRQTEPDFRPFLAEIDRLDLEPEVRADIMGGNMARLLGLRPLGATLHLSTGDAPSLSDPTRRPAQDAPVAQGAHPPPVDPTMATSAVAAAWPQTQVVFARHGIPWQDSPVPFWEPVCQAAAARGYDRDAQRRLIDELNEAGGPA
jgi:uncharacterized protein